MTRSLPPEGLRRSRHYRWWALGAISASSFLVNLDTSVVNVVLPQVARHFGAPLSDVQWVLSLQLLTLIAVLPTVGRISDIQGRTRIYLWGSVGYILAALLSAVAPSLGWLVASRAVAALGSSAVIANNMGILASLFPSEERGRAIGLVSSAVALGGFSGPGIGGFLLALFDWRAVFLLNVPFGLVALAAGFLLLPRRPPGRRVELPFDWWGSLTFPVLAGPALWALTYGPERGWGDPGVRGALVLATAGLAAFVAAERRAPAPIIDLRLFGQRPFTGAAGALIAAHMAMFAVLVVTPFFLAEGLGLAPQVLGLTMTAIPIVLMLVAPVGGWLSDRAGPSIPIVLGMAIATVGLVLLSLAGAGATAWDVTWRLSLFALGHGLFNTPNTALILSAIGRERLGMMGSLNGTLRKAGQVSGAVLGVSLLGWVLGRHGMAGGVAGGPQGLLSPEEVRAAYAAGAQAAYRVAAGLTAFAALASLGREARSTPSGAEPPRMPDGVSRNRPVP